MRILVVLSFYAPHWTGLTKYAQRAAEGWAALGDQVTVVCSQHDRTSSRDESLNGVRVVRCPTLLPISRAVVAPGFVPTIARLIPLHDVVIIHTPLPEACLVGWLCQRNHVPYTCVHHGDVVLPNGLRNRLYTSLMHQSALHAFAHADALCTHSSDYADHSQWLAPVRWRVRVITPPVTIVPSQSAGAREVYGIPADAFVVGIGGRMVHEKGFDRVFVHLEALKETLPTLLLLHVGAPQMPYEPSPDTPYGAFRSLGLLRDDEAMAAFFACCDVVLLPSRSDCFPSFAVEALRCGVPILVHDTPGLRSIIWQADAGRVIDCTDWHGLQQALATLPTRPDPVQMARVFDALASIATLRAVLQQTVAARTPAPATQAVLTRHLANEVDMAYRRRAQTLVHYLELNDAQVVLDCGCGQGVYVQLLRSLNQATVVGVDRDRQRLCEALPQPVLMADLAALPFAPATFDRVLFSEVLEHIPDDSDALQTLYSLLVPGGILAISVPCAQYPFWWDPISRIREVLGMPPLRAHPWIATIWSNHVRLYTPEHLAELLVGAGFVVEAIERQTRATVPFAHFIVYSIGKALLDRQILSHRWRAYADRRMGAANDGRWWHPFNLLRAVFRWCDLPNDRRIDQRGPGVIIVAKARKPQAEAPL